MSTGAASLAEIAEAVSWIEAKGNPLALLHCVLNYPTMDENAALGMIPALVRHSRSTSSATPTTPCPTI